MKTARKLFVILSFALVAIAAFSQTKATSTGWEKDDFTTDWAEYFWEFDGSNFQAGNNSITFTYTKGAHKLCLKDVRIIADGKIVLTDNTEKSAGAKKLEMYSLAYTKGVSSAYGTIRVRKW